MKNPNRASERRIARLIAFGVILYAVVMNLNRVSSALSWVLGVFSSILIGLVVALILDVPMHGFERLFARLGMKGAQAVFHAQRAVSVIPMHKLRIGILRRIALHVQRAVQLLPHVLSAFHAQQAEIVLHGQGHIPADAAGRAAHAGLAMKIRIIVRHQIFMRVSHRNPSFSRNDGIIRARESAVTHRFRKKMINLFVFNAIYGIT